MLKPIYVKFCLSANLSKRKTTVKLYKRKKNNKNNKEIFGRVRSLEHFSAFLTETQIVILKLKQKPFGTHLLVTTNAVTKQFI